MLWGTLDDGETAFKYKQEIKMTKYAKKCTK